MENSGTELQKRKKGRDAQRQEKGCGSIWADRGVAAKKKVSELKRVYKLVRFSVAAQLRPKTMAWQRDVYAFRGVGGCSWLVAFGGPAGATQQAGSNKQQCSAGTGRMGTWDIYASTYKRCVCGE